MFWLANLQKINFMLVFNTKSSKYKTVITKWAALMYYKEGYMVLQSEENFKDFIAVWGIYYKEGQYHAHQESQEKILLH